MEDKRVVILNIVGQSTSDPKNDPVGTDNPGDYIEMPHPMGHYHGEYAISMYDQIKNSLHSARLWSDDTYFKANAQIFFEITTLRDVTHMHNCHMATIAALVEFLENINSDNYEAINIQWQRLIDELIDKDVSDFKLTLPLGATDLDLSQPLQTPHENKIRIISAEYRSQKLDDLRSRLNTQYRKYRDIVLTRENIVQVKTQLQEWHSYHSLPNDLAVEHYVNKQIEFSDSIEAYRRVHLKPTLDKLTEQQKSFSESLILYCQQGNIAAAALLLKSNPDVKLDTKDQEGAMAIHYAAKSNQPRLVYMLLARGADPNARDQFNYRPLHYAVRRTISKDNLNRLEDANCMNTIDVLVAYGANIEAIADHNRTPLQTACVFGCYPGVVWLLSKGANVQTSEMIEDTSRTTMIKPPLTLTVENGHYDIAESLLLKGAAPLIDSNSLGPMYYSITQCRIDLALKLMEFGIFLTAQDSEALNKMFYRPTDTSSQKMCLQYVLKTWFNLTGLNSRNSNEYCPKIRLPDVIERMLEVNKKPQGIQRIAIHSTTRVYLPRDECNSKTKTRSTFSDAEIIGLQRSRSFQSEELQGSLNIKNSNLTSHDVESELNI